MRNYFNNKKVIGLLITVIAFVTILTVSYNTNDRVPVVQRLTNDITSVFSRVIAAPIRFIDRTFYVVNNLQDTYTENKRLKAELDDIVRVQVENESLRAENNNLKSQLELKSTLTEYQQISGTVIARNPDLWLDQIIIDRGERDGLSSGMSVMSNNGLVGRVTEVNPTSSKVVLLTTADQNATQTSAEINSEAGTVHGIITDYHEMSERLVMSRITSDLEINIGDQVATSGLGGVVPRGLFIGTVAEVTFDEHGLSRQVYIEPAANFDQIRYVLVVDREAENFDYDSEEEE